MKIKKIRVEESLEVGHPKKLLKLFTEDFFGSSVKNLHYQKSFLH